MILGGSNEGRVQPSLNASEGTGNFVGKLGIQLIYREKGPEGG